MAPCGPVHAAAQAACGAGPALSKTVKHVRDSRLGLGNGLSLGSRRHIAVSFRTRDEGRAVFEAVPTQPPSKLIAVIDMTQALSVFVVMAIQIGLIVRKQRVSEAKPTMKISQQIASPIDPLVSLSEHQPLFLAWALACALFAKVFAPRKLEIQAKGVASQDLRQKADSVHLKESLRHVERQLSKMQSRVMICAEQFRLIRRATDESRLATNEVLAQHGTALAEVQEQANSLQRVLSSLQDVVVKQIEVITPPIKLLNTRVRILEDELRQVKDRSGDSPTTANVDADAAHSEGGPSMAEASYHPTVQPTQVMPSPALAASSCAKEAATRPDERSCSSIRSEFNDSSSRDKVSVSAPAHHEEVSTDATAAHAIHTAADSDTAGSPRVPVATQARSQVADKRPKPHTQGARSPGAFPSSDGRMMQISWRASTSVAAQHDAHSASNGTGVRSPRALAENFEDTQLRPASVPAPFAHDAVLPESSEGLQEAQWSSRERTAMTHRLMDLCRSYDAEAVAGYQPVQHALVAAASNGLPDGFVLGTRSALPRRAEQRWRQMGKAIQPFILGHVGGVGVRRHQSGDVMPAAAASSVPDDRAKLQVINVSGSRTNAAGKSQRLDGQEGEGSDMQGERAHVPLEQSQSDVRLMAEHGLLTLLTCAVTSVVLAAPVV